MCYTVNARCSLCKNIERHTAHTIVSWPNPKQWVMAHTYDLMMIIRPSIYILSCITREMGKLKHNPTYGFWLNIWYARSSIVGFMSRCISNKEHCLSPCMACQYHMMTSWNRNILRVTGHLCREFNGHRWIPNPTASDAELWYFLWFAP